MMVAQCMRWYRCWLNLGAGPSQPSAAYTTPSSPCSVSARRPRGTSTYTRYWLGPHWPSGMYMHMCGQRHVQHTLKALIKCILSRLWHYHVYSLEHGCKSIVSSTSNSVGWDGMGLGRLSETICGDWTAILLEHALSWIYNSSRRSAWNR